MFSLISQEYIIRVQRGVSSENSWQVNTLITTSGGTRQGQSVWLFGRNTDWRTCQEMNWPITAVLSITCVCVFVAGDSALQWLWCSQRQSDGEFHTSQSHTALRVLMHTDGQAEKCVVLQQCFEILSDWHEFKLLFCCWRMKLQTFHNQALKLSMFHTEKRY